MYDERVVTRMQQEFVSALEEVQAENPDVECGFEVDLGVSIALTSGQAYAASQETVHEFFRREFGYTPGQYASLRP